MLPIVLFSSIFLLTSNLSQSSTQQIPSCIDEDGKIVDWYIAYKLPALSYQPEPFNTGYAYAYITSENVRGVEPVADTIRDDADLDSIVFLNKFKNLLLKYLGFFNTNSKQKKSNHGKVNDNNKLYWTVSAKLISDPDSMIMRTLGVAYQKNKTKNLNKLNSIFYNDQPPQSSDSDEGTTSSNSRAHAKGVVMIDDVSGNGVWLTHSTPQFPPQRNLNLEYYDNSKRFGQTYMCMNFDVGRSGKQIINHLINMTPTVYDSQISNHLLTLIPELNFLALEGERRKNRGQVDKLAQVITTRQGQDLYLYSKSSKFGDDMYSGWIEKELQTSLYVETWRRGAGNPLDSTCPRNDFHVNNIQDMKVIEGSNRVDWNYLQDHSKWAISENIDPGAVCISDINRMESQFKRGGGAVCIKCPSCWTVFSDTIADLEPCPKSKKPKTNSSLDLSVNTSSSEDLIRKLGELVLH